MARAAKKPEVVNGAEGEAVDITPDPAQHVFMDGEMRDIADLGTDNPRERRIMVAGVSFEHVDEHPSGCWNYRRM
mgnify:CR=1 FL=1